MIPALPLASPAAPRSIAKQRSQKGFTIVELSIAVAIAGVLLVSAISLVQTVLATSRANDTITLLSRAFAQIEKIWAEAPNYAGLTLASAGAAGAFEGMQVTRDSTGLVTGVTNRFNRPIFAGVVNDIPSSGQQRGYVLTFAGIPRSVCADIVTAAASSGIRGVIITPETATTTTTAANTAVSLSATGTLSTTAGVVPLDGSGTVPNIGVMTGVSGCGTPNGSVALTFVGWK